LPRQDGIIFLLKQKLVDHYKINRKKYKNNDGQNMRLDDVILSIREELGI